MVDSNFANMGANPGTNRPSPSQPRLTPDTAKTTPAFCTFCWGTALGLVIGAFCGAFLPDQLLGSGPAPTAAFGPAATPASVAATSQHQNILAQVPHEPDAD